MQVDHFTPWKLLDVQYVVIGEDVTSIGMFAFEDADIIEVTILGNVSIEDFAFNNCRSLTTVNVMGSISTVGHVSFYACIKLTEIALDAVTSMDYFAFYGCDLREVSLPADLLFIGEGAFGMNPNLSLSIDKDNPNYTVEDGALFNKEMTTLMWMPGGMTGTYNVPSGVTTIAEGVFIYSKLTNVILPEGLITISQFAFAASDLTSIIIPESVKTIGLYAFGACTQLSSIILLGIPNDIGISAFDLADDMMMVSETVETVKCDVYTSEEGILDDYKGEHTVFIYLTTPPGTYEISFELVKAPSGTAVPASIFVVPRTVTDVSMPIEGYVLEITINNVRSEDGSFTMPEHNVVVKLSYFKIFTLNFMVDDQIFDTMTVKEGDAPTMPADTPVKESTVAKDFVFKEWGGFSEITGVTEDMNFNAEFTEITKRYTITFESEGKVISSDKFDYDSEIVLPNAPIKGLTDEFEYLFKEWEGYAAGDKVSGDMTFNAEFEPVKRKYAVTFNGYVEPVTFFVEYGSSFNIPGTVPVKASTADKYYVFTDWIGYIEGMIVKGDMEFEPRFRAVLKLTEADIDDAINEDVIVVGDDDSEQVSISKDTIDIVNDKTSGDSNVKDLEVKTQNGSITLSSSVIGFLKDKMAEDSKEDVSVNITNMEKESLLPAIRSLVGDRPVYSIKISDIKTFNGEKILIRLNYELKEGEDPNNLIVWYIDDEGTKLTGHVCKYAEDDMGGYVTFETDHLSYYSVGYELSNNSHTMLGYAVATIALASAVVTVVVLLRKD